MSTVANDQPAEPGVERVARRHFAIVALLTVLAGSAIRGCSELGMMREHGPDAQMAIWQAFLIAKLLFWLVTGCVVVLVAVGLFKFTGSKILGTLLMGGWCAVVIWASSAYVGGQRALADAANPGTSPERLESLVEFDGVQAGYELDNRLAANPSTPVSAVRKLALKKDQLGTHMILARNPRTPQDVLQQLGKLNDQYIQDALKTNPNYLPPPAAAAGP
jgi:hypothetical protein